MVQLQSSDCEVMHCTITSAYHKHPAPYAADVCVGLASAGTL